MTEEELHGVIKRNRRRNRDAVASALMLALSGAITPADFMDRVDAAHDDACAEYVRAGARATQVMIQV